MTAEPGKWKDALKFAVREVRRLGMFGLTQRELERFSSAMLTDARQLAAQGNKISNGGWGRRRRGCCFFPCVCVFCLFVCILVRVLFTYTDASVQGAGAAAVVAGSGSRSSIV